MTQSGESKDTPPVVNDEMSTRTQGLTGADERSAGADRDLAGRLEFEMLIADLIARFVNIPSDQIDSEIKNAERGICEVLGLDPFYVANEGRFVVFLPDEQAARALALLPAARRIGRVTGAGRTGVVARSALGGTRVLDLLSGEQLPRIC